MDHFVAEIRSALDGGLYTIALQSTLALVDISAALASEDGRTTRKKFEAWFTEHFKTAYEWLDARDVYDLRCGILHQGRTASTRYDAIVFTIPGPIYIHNNLMDNALNLNVVTFCTEIIDTVEAWWQTAREDEPVRTNAKYLVQERSRGLAPYIVGLPVLA